MNRQLVFDHRPTGRRVPVRRVGPILMALGCLLACILPAPAAEQPERPTLQDTYDEAKKLAETPDGLQQAIQKYQSVIAAHRANEKLYHSALEQLADSYREADRKEDGIRFFVGLVLEMMEGNRRDVLREILQQYQLKDPELFKRVVGNMGQPKRRIVPAMPSKQLSDAILQRKDQQLREKSLQRVREMLAAGSTVEDQKTGLATLRAAMKAKFDHAAFRPLVLPLLESENAQIRELALRCLPGLDATTEDLAKVVPMAEDEASEVRIASASALIQIAKGAEEETVVPALMKVLRDEDPEVIEQATRSMWGQYSTPEFSDLLIELSRKPKHRGTAIYFGLSTMRTKNVAVCRRLVEELGDPDWNNSGRAAWGLGYGVVDEAKPIVEQGLLEALPEETHSYTRAQEFRALRRVATEASRAYLQSVVDSELETEESKKAAREILADLDAAR